MVPDTTPGPWHVFPYGDRTVVDESNGVVADCHVRSADARLISAAPDLYEVLKAARSDPAVNLGTHEAAADAALAKAEVTT